MSRVLAIVALVVGVFAGTARADDPVILTTDHYDIRGVTSARIATIARDLEIDFADFSARFTGARIGGRLAVRIFASGEAIAQQIPAEQRVRKSYGAMFDHERKELWIALSEKDAELFSVLRHESFHQFAFYALGEQLPTWLNEGLAMWFQDVAIDAKGKAVRDDAVRRARALRLLMVWDTPARLPIDTYLSLDYDGFHGGGNEGTNYDLGWAICVWLLEDCKGGQAILGKYLDSLKRNPKEGFGSYIGDFDKAANAIEARLRAVYAPKEPAKKAKP